MRVNMGKVWKRVCASLSVLAFVFAVTGSAFAQSDTGTITGTVTDPKGLAMSGVNILIHNADTGADMKPIVTTESGIYVLTLLPPGNYEHHRQPDGILQRRTQERRAASRPDDPHRRLHAGGYAAIPGHCDHGSSGTGNRKDREFAEHQRGPGEQPAGQFAALGTTGAADAGRQL